MTNQTIQGLLSTYFEFHLIFFQKSPKREASKMFTQYLINQAKKPSGIVGQVIAKIWTSYFKKLSLWTIKQTTIIDNSRVLEIGYGGGSTIKNLLALNKHLEIHGIDISKESYQVAKRINSDAIQNGDVHLRIGNVDALPYQNDYFDLVFAIQTHIFWDDLKKGFLEIYRVMSTHSTLIIACEKEKINYHMPEYTATHALDNILKNVGFAKIEVRQNQNWVLYIVYKAISVDAD